MKKPTVDCPLLPKFLIETNVARIQGLYLDLCGR